MSSRAIDIQFNRSRFCARLNEFSTIGRDASGAMNRPFGSQAERVARLWLKQLAEEAVGLDVVIDPIANVWGIAAGEEDLSVIAVGSHHDSVPNGGHLDGALGVLIAIELIQTLKEAGYHHRHPLAFVSFTAEEPNPFNLSTLGSRTITGRLTEDQLQAAKDWNGRTLADAVADAGGDLQRVKMARKRPQDLATFLELHIEQGRRLERAKVPVGVVTGICGIFRENISVAGEANHAGTTQMEDRRDALAAAAEMIVAAELVIQKRDLPDLVGTVGRITVEPNAVNVVPGQCQFILEIRAGNTETIASVRDEVTRQWKEIANRRQVQFYSSLILDQCPEPMDTVVMDHLSRAASDLNIPYLELASMAGHDAAHLSSVTRTGMLFVPSVDGKSHCKEEQTDIEDIEHAFLVLAHAVMGLDQI